MSSEHFKEVAILTPGQFGTAIGEVLARNGHDVTLGFRTVSSYQHFLETGESPRLPGFKLHESIRGTTDLSSLVTRAGSILLSVSAPHISEFFPQIKDDINPGADVWSLIKGFDSTTGMRISEFLLVQQPSLRRRLAVLSGPNLAYPVARGLPATTVIASENEELAQKIAGDFKGSTIRAYWSSDVIGTELGGALKNIISFAAGMNDGMEYGDNAYAALMTRGLAELAGLTVLEGGLERTSTGNAGLGDLIVSCRSGRNYRAGVSYGKFAIGAEGGIDIKTLIESGETLEGLSAAEPAVRLVNKHDADFPIFVTMNSIINEELDPKTVFKMLMERELTSEDPEPVIDRRIIRWINWAFHGWSRKHRSPLQVVKDLWYERLTTNLLKGIVKP